MVQLFQNKQVLKQHLDSILKENSSIGFVPTMGALHDGHLSLIHKALSENEIVVVSIFVNPTQFNNAEDLEKYPRNLAVDLIKIANNCGDCLVYAPQVEDIYNGNTTAEHFDFDGIEFELEGKFRPGHFDGVGSVVKKLFEIVKPNKAYFGEKDFQQFLIIEKLTHNFFPNIEVICCPILRESNGLAMSSRNERLTLKEREEAGIIYDVLKSVKIKFEKDSIEAIKEWVILKIEAKNLKLEYFEIANEKSLKPCISKDNEVKYRAFIAIYVNNIRLIDTISLN